MIHSNVCFLILLICCWVVTASLMAEKTNVGVAVFVADNTYVCGCGSDVACGGITNGLIDEVHRRHKLHRPHVYYICILYFKIWI